MAASDEEGDYDMLREEQERELEAALERGITLGESNSVLLVGYRGSGKTLVLNRVLDTLQTRHRRRRRAHPCVCI